MKHLVYSNKDTIETMSKLKYKFADKKLFDTDFGEFIYFSLVLDSHRPRIKFYGGTKETDTTRTASMMKFDAHGPGDVVLQPWMTKRNCPNAFDGQYLEGLRDFISKVKPILLLVWFRHLDESEALRYLVELVDTKDLNSFA